MKKRNAFLVLLLIAGFCMSISCSNEDEMNYQTESRLATLKQQYLKYAEEYGVNSLYFNDEKMKKFINMTESEVESEVAEIALCLGIKNAKTKNSLKKRARRVGLQEEPGGGDYDDSYTGSFTDVITKDSLEFTVSCTFTVRPKGTDAFSVNSVTFYEKKYNQNGILICENGPFDPDSFHGYLRAPISGQSSGPEAHYGIPYTVNISNNVNYIFSFSFNRTYDYTHN